MPVMRTRVKRVAEVKDWHLSYAEVAAIVGHEIAAELAGQEHDIVWMFPMSTEYKRDVMLSVLASRRWRMYYKGDMTVFDCDSWSNDVSPSGTYKYQVWVVPSSDGTAMLYIHDYDTRSTHGMYAAVPLDEDYFDFLGTMRYEGTDKEWSEVED